MPAHRTILFALALATAFASLAGQTPPSATKAVFDLVRADDGPGLLRHLTDRPADRDVRNESEEQPLHVAAHRNRRTCLAVLLELGADANATTYNQFTPLHLAASSGHLEVCKALVKAGARLDPQSVAGTPLQMAAAANARGVAAWLQNAGASLDLSSAVYLGDEAWVAKLLREDSELKVDRAVLQRAAAAGMTRIVAMLLDRPVVEWPEWQGRPLDLTWFAAPHVDTLALLLERGADPKIRFHGDRITGGTTLLHRAAEADAVASCDLLIGQGVPVDVKDDAGCTPLALAATAGKTGAVKRLIEHGARSHRTETGRSSALHRVLRGVDEGYRQEERAQRVHLAEMLLDDGTPLDLTAAVILGRIDSVRAMLAADPGVVGEGPAAVDLVSRAARMGRRAIVELLLDAGVPVNGKGYGDYAPLHWAAFWNRVEVIDLLHARGAELNPRTDFQATPLHEAVRCNALEAARRLLELGADRTLKNRDGARPEQLAAETPRPEAFQALFAPPK